MMPVAPSARAVANASTRRDIQPSRPNTGATRAAAGAAGIEAEFRSLAIIDALLADFLQLHDGIGMLAAEALARRHETRLQLVDFGRLHDAVMAALRHHLVDQLAVFGDGFLPLPRDDLGQDRKSTRLNSSHV